MKPRLSPGLHQQLILTPQLRQAIRLLQLSTVELEAEIAEAVASNPLLSHRVAVALEKGGLERRGEIIRRVMTMRGGDRPKAAHVEFDQVSVMPRSMWEPWLMFRKPLEGRVQDNLRRWGTGGFRRIGPARRRSHHQPDDRSRNNAARRPVIRHRQHG